MPRPVNIAIALTELRNTANILDKDDHPCTAQLMRHSIDTLEKTIDKLVEVYEAYNIIVNKAKIKQTGRCSYVLKCPLNFDETMKVIDTCKYCTKKKEDSEDAN